ncbi:MAG: porin, partial [Gammaproteobacteria bacterium]|nr:porin [Gammaproteobacteria bacterium]
MYKKLIAATVAAGLGFSAAVSADIKIIGIIQMELVSTSSDTQVDGLTLDDGARSAIGSGSASYIGVAGSHDLGNNMTGLYKARFAYSPDDGDTGDGRALKQKDVFVGLKAEFGTLLAGRMSTPYKTSTAKWDPFYTTFLQARGANGMSTLHNGEAANTLAYANTFGAVSFVGAVALDETAADDHTVIASLNMPMNDSLDLALAFLRDSSGDGATAAKLAVKWTGDGNGAVLQYESLDAGLGNLDA